MAGICDHPLIPNHMSSLAKVINHFRYTSRGLNALKVYRPIARKIKNIKYK